MKTLSPSVQRFDDAADDEPTCVLRTDIYPQAVIHRLRQEIIADMHPHDAHTLLTTVSQSRRRRDARTIVRDGNEEDLRPTLAIADAEIPVQEIPFVVEAQDIRSRSDIEVHFARKGKDAAKFRSIHPLIDAGEQVHGVEKWIYVSDTPDSKPHIVIKEICKSMSADDFAYYRERLARCQHSLARCPAVHVLAHKFGEYEDERHCHRRLEFQYWLPESMQDSLILQSRYTEADSSLEPVEYARLNEALFEGKAHEDLHAEDLAKFFDLRSFERLKDAMRDDASLQGQLQMFFESAIDVTMEHGEALDFVGKRNFFVVKDKNGLWKTVPVDPIFPEEISMQDIIYILRRIQDGAPLKDDEWIPLINAMASVRFVNLMAEVTGSQRRLRIIPEDLHIDYSRILEQLQCYYREYKNRLNRKVVAA